MNKGMISVGIIDLDDSIYSNMLVSYFDENQTYRQYLKISKVTEDAIAKDDEMDLLLIIPKNFVANMIRMEHHPIEVILKTNDLTKTVFIKNLMQVFENYVKEVEVNCAALYELMQKHQYGKRDIEKMNEKISYELVLTALGKDDFFHMDVVKDIRATSLVTYYSFEFLFLMICYAAIYGGIQYLKEKNLGIVARIASISSSLLSYLFGKTMLLSGLVSGSLLIISLVFKVIFHITIQPLTFLYLMGVIFLANSCFLLLAIGVDNVKNFTFVANAILLFSAIVGAGVLPIMYLGERLGKLSKYSYNYWYLKAIIISGIHGRLPVGIYIGLFLGGMFVLMLCSILVKKRGYYSAGH